MKQYERLTKRNANGEVRTVKTPKSSYIQEVYEEWDEINRELKLRLAELEDKIEAGTLVELPCKIGDVAYTRYGGCINKWEVSEIDIFDFDILVKLEHNGTLGWTTAYLSEVGDTLFFNKAEAQKMLEEIKRLEEIKNGNNDRLPK